MVVPANEAVPNPLLRQVREARNLTQDGVADGLMQLGAKGATGGLVSKWERGICRPNRFHRRLLCQFFDASPKELGFTAGINQSGSEVSEDELVAALLEAAVPAASGVGGVVEGMRQQTLARAHAEYGHKDAFLQAIDAAEALAAGLGAEAADWGNEFTITNVRHERAHGHTLLWEPEVALGIYLAADSGLHLTSLRDIGNFTILKAQAHTYAGNVDIGVNLAIEGLGFARRYGSTRHVSRVQRMHDRLSNTPIGSSARMRDLADALRAA